MGNALQTFNSVVHIVPATKALSSFDSWLNDAVPTIEGAVFGVVFKYRFVNITHLASNIKNILYRFTSPLICVATTEKPDSLMAKLAGDCMLTRDALYTDLSGEAFIHKRNEAKSSHLYHNGHNDFIPTTLAYFIVVNASRWIFAWKVDSIGGSLILRMHKI